MKRAVFVMLGLGALACALTAAYAVIELRGSMAPAPAEMFAYQRQTESVTGLPVLWQAPSFSFKDQHGKTTTERDLNGQVWIADFIYTSCTNVCPVISAKRALLERKLAGVPLRFVSFSVDPEHDTPEALSAYAAIWGGDERWLLFSTDRDGLNTLASGMRVAVEPTGDSQNPILHSNMFLLVDTKGSVRGVYDSADREALERLVTDAKGLLGNTPTTAPLADANANGQALFMSLGCAACHNNDRVAPSLAGVLGRPRKLAGGTEVNADTAYLKESIVAPGSKVVLGYLNLMPAYANELTEAQIDSLVGYIQTLPDAATPKTPASGATPGPGTQAAAVGTAGAPAVEPKGNESAALGIDPVCKMSVRIAASTPHFALDGHEYYFCSEMCRDRFAKNPNQYLKSGH